MKESFLHYLWANQLFNQDTLLTDSNELLSIISPGDCTGLDGPDFFNARICIGNQEWAGNVEIHLKASDWFCHNHEKDVRYDSIILHVVWENDMPIYRVNGSLIPTLELKGKVSGELLLRYEELMLPKQYLYCEDKLPNLDSLFLLQWKERLFFERLSAKVKPIEEFVKDKQGHWSQAFFCFLAKSFGLNANGEAFFSAFRYFPISIVHKQAYSLLQLESMFLGVVGLLDVDFDLRDEYCKSLVREWDFLKHKYTLQSLNAASLRFFQLRPPNFPSIRLVQLAAFYFHNGVSVNSLFQEQLTLQEIYLMFDVKVSDYWKTHYVVNKESKSSTKKLSKEFVDLLIVNVIVPFQFAYQFENNVQGDISEYLLDLLSQIKPERNSVVKMFESYNIPVDHAMDSQALLQLKKQYCDRKRCLECAIGKRMMK
ncbi:MULTISPECIES: DUF2851 family protein [Myroides]|uniref:DUF2851 family protein n=1 Tax=Myroides albus TaxID=2562892 RepID=A0A6I3LNA5_9FLAO|nr:MULTISPECIES: DUF2851 family protein [Myroides]MTG98790.1 DUF2851 family protein [Myroides albus]MVX34257.1 DUF2851 family protein [Myroides sp. LoEW2-1]UVD80674.1 DUF2851 family protein [Myroides albus]